jgi:hypothetical protein
VSDWEKLKREEDRLDREQEMAELAILQAHQAAIDSLARSQRLKKQRALLRERGGEMLRRGLQTLDELDEVEERERKDREEQADQSATVAVPSDADLFASLSPSFFET